MSTKSHLLAHVMQLSRKFYIGWKSSLKIFVLNTASVKYFSCTNVYGIQGFSSSKSGTKYQYLSEWKTILIMVCNVYMATKDQSYDGSIVKAFRVRTDKE